MKQLEKDIQRLKKEIAEARGKLVSAEAVLKDDELYMKDLTTRCQDRANDYDQRSAMRGDEVAALSQALKVLKGTVAKKDSANVRAMFVQKAPVVVSSDAAKVTLKTVSLLQEVE